MLDLAVIILTKDEKLHIARCLERLRDLNPLQIFVVDCFSTDGTQEIVENFKRVGPMKGMSINVVEQEWPGLHAKQFNWALDNLPIVAKWVLRMDADEYLTPETIERLKAELPKMSDDVTGLTLELKRRFMGGEIRHATNGIRLLRVFRHGTGRCEERAMDEHIILSEGHYIDFDGSFYDDNLNSFEWWQEKHRGYARREAVDAVSLFRNPERLKNPSPTDRKKMKYYKLPPYFRAVVYFCLRYFLKGGFLDGVAGWRWNFWQGLWYRWIVDKEIGRMKVGGIPSA
jgi:glycosyltransferase involved in cell wall biosynthesis